jgi:hypothetical protein
MKPSRIGGNRQRMFDLVSYGRRGPGHPDRFTPEQIAQITRTVRRTPEVVVKVSGGGNTPGAVIAHFQYISRKGELELETGDGEQVRGKDEITSLVESWDLDLDAMEDRHNHRMRGGRTLTPKLVHNIVLSMPARTPPERLLAASRSFAREEFGLQHRYALALHTDQDHPHVHLVVSAHRFEGGRLNIRKADLRRYREQFALQLRAQGVAANATPTQIRGRLTDHQRDGIYRSALRGESSVEWERERKDSLPTGPGQSGEVRSQSIIAETAGAVRRDWLAVTGTLRSQGLDQLAAEVERYQESLTVPKPRRRSERKLSTKDPIGIRPKQIELIR